jgi:hypothetical protein
MEQGQHPQERLGKTTKNYETTDAPGKLAEYEVCKNKSRESWQMKHLCSGFVCGNRKQPRDSIEDHPGVFRPS